MTDAEFIEKWSYWKFALGSQNKDHDPNTLIEQMSSMVWGIGVFRSAMHSWAKEQHPGTDEFKVNPVLFHFIFDNFFKSFCLSLRRITDGGLLEDGDGKNDRSVISIPSLLRDIKTHREDYTRKRLFLAVGRDYDTKIVQKRHDEYANQFRAGQVYAVPQDLWVDLSEGEHARWDEISCVSPAERSVTDIIVLEYLDHLITEATAINTNIKFLTDKFYAHASTPESRTSASGKEETVSLAQLIDLTLQCGKLVNSISNILADAVWPFLPVAQFDKWDNWGTGWTATQEELSAVWLDWQMQVKRLEHLPMPATVPLTP